VAHACHRQGLDDNMPESFVARFESENAGHTLRGCGRAVHTVLSDTAKSFGLRRGVALHAPEVAAAVHRSERNDPHHIGEFEVESITDQQIRFSGMWYEFQWHACEECSWVLQATPGRCSG
jgi:hypothetical protein